MNIEQNTNIPLEQIVFEYHSKNPLIKWLFLRRLQTTVNFVKILKPKSLLDLGCGEGTFIEFLIKQMDISNLQAVDINEKILELNEKIKKCHFYQQDLLRTNFKDKTFNVVTALDVLEHIKDIKKGIEEIKRILKPGAFLITSEPTESILYKTLRFIAKGTYSMETDPGAGKHYYQAEQIDKIIQSQGFKKIKSKKIPLFYPFDLFHINLYKLNIKK